MEPINSNLNTKTPEILSSNIETITLKPESNSLFSSIPAFYLKSSYLL